MKVKDLPLWEQEEGLFLMHNGKKIILLNNRGRLGTGMFVFFTKVDGFRETSLVHPYGKVQQEK